MKIDKALERERQSKKARHGMRESGRSVKKLQEILARKAEKARKKQEDEARKFKEAVLTGK